MTSPAASTNLSGVMSCPGLHCPGCSEGQSLGILAAVVVGLVVAAGTVQWVAERIWWIGSAVAVCFALAVAAGMWLERLADRRGARYAAAHGILSRADVILPAPARVAAVDAEPVPPAIVSAPQTVITGGIHVWLTGLPDEAQAAVIRKAIPGIVGDASPKEMNDGADQAAARDVLYRTRVLPRRQPPVASLSTVTAVSAGLRYGSGRRGQFGVRDRSQASIRPQQGPRGLRD